MEERSDVHCTNCGCDFIVVLDLGLEGNHEFTCPYCLHVHYRVVRAGVVTEDRWRSSMLTWQASTLTVSNTTITMSTSNSYTWSSWINGSNLTSS